jgi:hypothetical protein
MSLPWVRLDSNIAWHDKTVKVLSCRGGKAAMLAYVFALGWSGGQGTDGHIPKAILPLIHATPQDASVLVSVGLWLPDADGDGWWIHNFERRQETAAASEARREKARKAAEARWRPPSTTGHVKRVQ